MVLCLAIVSVLLDGSSLYAQTGCGNVSVSLSSDYQLALGTSANGDTYTWVLKGQTVARGAISQLALFQFNSSLQSTAGVGPTKSGPLAWAAGLVL